MKTLGYPNYFHPYIEKIPEGIAAAELLAHGVKETIKSLAMVSDKAANGAYAEGKWSIKELVQHIIDSERVFCYRAMCIARGDKAQLPGFEHEQYVANSDSNNRSLKGLLEELKNTRASTINLFQSMSKRMLAEKGNANGIEITPEKIQFIIIGHEIHHRQIIETRYL